MKNNLHQSGQKQPETPFSGSRLKISGDALPVKPPSPEIASREPLTIPGWLLELNCF
jgi:hypothetical protein